MGDSVKGMGALSLGETAVGGGIQLGIDADRFVRARDFVLRNARLIDRHLSACSRVDRTSQCAMRCALIEIRTADSAMRLSRTSGVRRANRLMGR